MSNGFNLPALTGVLTPNKTNQFPKPLGQEDIAQYLLSTLQFTHIRPDMSIISVLHI
jgi:hypothetical protein